MKAGYKIENRICDNPRNILVQNYTDSNKIVNVGFYNISVYSNYNIGIWKIKYKNSK